MITKPDLLFDKGDQNRESDKPYLTSLQIEAFKQQSAFLMPEDNTNQAICQRLINAFSPNVQTFSHAGFSKDVGLDLLVRTLIAPKNSSAPFIHYVMSMAPVDISTAKYREEIADELIENREMLSGLARISNKLNATAKCLISWEYEQNNSLRDSTVILNPAKALIQDIEIVQNYVQAINGLEEALKDSTSTGLRRLYQYAKDVKATSKFKTIAYALDCFLNVKYAEVGVTIASDFSVTNLVFLPPKEQAEKGKIWQTIENYFTKLVNWKKEKKKKAEQASMEETMKGLFQDVFQNMLNRFTGKPDTYHKLMAQAFDHLIKASRQQISATILIEGDIDYHSCAVGFYDFLVDNKLPATRAELLPMKERTHIIEGMKNPLINLQTIPDGCHVKYAAGIIVANDFQADPNSNMIILSGPNGGGKSRHVTSIDLIYILAQNGVHVFAKHYRASIVDNILTQFVLPDDFAGDGRWKKEVSRIMANVIYRATPYSLCTIDDFGSGTSYEEARAPALEVLYGLRRLAPVTLMNTHIHELAKDIESGEFPCARNMRMELVVQPDTDIVPTYRIVEGKAGKSYAAEIAAGLGLTRANIDANIAGRIERGELPVHLIRT